VRTTPDQKFTFDFTGPLTQEQAECIYSSGRESAEGVKFSKKLGRILKDAIRLSKKDLPDP
jgi:hypothetical protein